MCSLSCQGQSFSRNLMLGQDTGQSNCRKNPRTLPRSNTPFGRYRFLRLPFGLKSSQDGFQRKIDECYEALGGVVALVVGIIYIWSFPRGTRQQPQKCTCCSYTRERHQTKRRQT